METGADSNSEQFCFHWKYICGPFSLLKSKYERLQNDYKSYMG